MKQPLEIPDEMPTALAIFPLPGVLLLPGAQLPLNIFEPRYLDMVRDAMAGARLIGMVQPRDPHADLRHPEVYPVGCAGQITAFQETDDGRYQITLTGLSRFAIVQEFDSMTLYRQVQPDWRRFAGDLDRGPETLADRAGFRSGLEAYFAAHEISPDWPAVDASADGDLVNFLAMICPFAPAERQALLESADLAARAEIMLSLMDMAVRLKQGGTVGVSEDDDDEQPVH